MPAVGDWEVRAGGMTLITVSTMLTAGIGLMGIRTVLQSGIILITMDGCTRTEVPLTDISLMTAVHGLCMGKK